MSNRAWVTLATNDSYGLGALVLAHSLRRVNSTYPAVVLVTPSLTDTMRDRLAAVFSEVITVDVLDSRDEAHLALLARPELGITFTKIHCWSLTQYEKCVFLDADTLVVQNSDELFEREELSAAPDVGWPDCFNSGVFVFKPSKETFDALIKFAQERGSFDGGDQGLLNSFFSDWARGDINKHLPFLYNVTSAAFYSYLPAFKHFGQDLKIIHFIGVAKPWLQNFNWDTQTVECPSHLQGTLQLWWEIFVSSVHTQLEANMTGVAGVLARVASPGASSSDRGAAIDELTRRQGWEQGNIDYMGADSFDNIWAKISQTLNQAPPKEASPPKDIKQPSPPKEQAPAAVQSAPVEQPAVVAAEKGTLAPSESVPKPAPIVSEKQPSPPKEIVEPSVIPAPIVPESVEDTSKAENPKNATAVPPTPPVTPKSPSEPSTPVTESLPLDVSTEEPPATVAPVAPALESPQESSVIPVETTAAPVETTAAPVEAVAAPEEAPKQTSTVPEQVPVPVAETSAAEPSPVVAPQSPAEAPAVPVAAPASPLAAAEALVSSAVEAVESSVPSSVSTPEKSLELTGTATDSPPLAHTPGKEDPSVTPAKCPNRACSLM